MGGLVVGVKVGLDVGAFDVGLKVEHLSTAQKGPFDEMGVV